MKSPLVISAALAVFSSTSVFSATVVNSLSAPTVDADDVSNIGSTVTGESKYYSDVEAPLGQTFTASVTGTLTSFTIRISGGRTTNSANEAIDFQFGTITSPGGVWTFNQSYSELAEINESWASDSYITVTLDTPQSVTAGTEYGVILFAEDFGSWSAGGIATASRAAGSSYTDGVAITRGAPQTFDHIFEANIVAVPEPSVALLSGLGVMLLLRRRKS